MKRGEQRIASGNFCGETNDIIYIRTKRRVTWKNVTFLDKVTLLAATEWSVVKSGLPLKEGNNVERKPLSSLMNLHYRNSEFSVSIPSRYAALSDEGNLDIEKINEYFGKTRRKAALKVKEVKKKGESP